MAPFDSVQCIQVINSIPHELWAYLVSFMRQGEILVENCDFSCPTCTVSRPPSEYYHEVWHQNTRMAIGGAPRRRKKFEGG